MIAEDYWGLGTGHVPWVFSAVSLISSPYTKTYHPDDTEDTPLGNDP